MQTIGFKKRIRGYEEDLFSLGQTYIVKVMNDL